MRRGAIRIGRRLRIAEGGSWGGKRGSPSQELRRRCGSVCAFSWCGDFPCTVFQVSVGSLAEKAGLQVGDAILKINGKDVFQLRHKEAKDEMVRAGNNFEVLVRR